MGWEESLFGSLWGFFRRRDARIDEARRPHGVLLNDAARARWHILASAVAGCRVAIHEAERPSEPSDARSGTSAHGGSAGSTLRLPGTFWFSEVAEENEAALLFRVLYGATSIRQRLHLGNLATDSERTLGTLLAIPATLDCVRRELQGAAEIYARLAPRELSSRPQLARLRGPDLALELLAQARLGVNVRERKEIPDDVRGWLDGALREHPGTAETLRASVERTHAFVRGASCRGIALFGSLLAQGNAIDPSQTPPDDLAEGASGTERRANPKDHVRRVVLTNQEEQENPLVHSFEKIHTIESHRGGSKRADEADELDEHADALDDADIREVVRSNKRAKSVYRADMSFETETREREESDIATAIPYDEWDERARRYRENWCSVRVDTAPRSLSPHETESTTKALLAREQRVVQHLRSRFEQLADARRLAPRQLDGPELDLSALVDRHASLRAGRTGVERLYVTKRTPMPATALLLLLDSSLSTDSWVRGRRVMDVAKETLLVLGEALRPLEIQTYVGSFFSHTRRDCRWIEVKSFEGAWPEARRRLLALEPTGYTRIGPALRHAATLLDAVDARRKILLLVSDGKPTDHDHYEGRHGLQDVKQAVREAKRLGIATFALAIDAEPRLYLPQMFGLRGFKTILQPRDVAHAMDDLWSFCLG